MPQLASPGLGSQAANSGVAQLQIGLRYWIVALVVAAGGLFALDRFFETGRIWRQPVSLLLNDPTDRATHAAWLLNQPPNGRRKIVLLGASTAWAAMELPGDGVTQLFTQALSRRDVEFLSLAVGNACYDEHLLLLENLLRRGHKVELVIAFTTPGCFVEEKEGRRPDASRAVQMPLASKWLVDTHRQIMEPSFGERWDRWLVQKTALARYRRPVNAWIRRRVSRAARGLAFWHIELRYDPYAKPWNGRLVGQNLKRYTRVSEWPKKMTWDHPEWSRLTSFLVHARQSGVPVLIVEVPWSPLMRQLAEPIRVPYTQTLQKLASRYSAEYWDPNRELYLGSEYFADLSHVTQAGKALFLKAAIPKAVQVLRLSQVQTLGQGRTQGPGEIYRLR
jgi:hypothetical protein